MKIYIIATTYNGNIWYFKGDENLTQDYKQASFYNTKSEADAQCVALNLKNAHNCIMQVGELRTKATK